MHFTTSRYRHFIAIILLCASAPSVLAQEAASFFKGNCVSCHTIGGGRLVGPDLRNVTQRKSRDWLINFISDPPAILASGDPYASQILSEARGIAMPKVAAMNRELAANLLSYIDAESRKEPSASTAGPRLLTPEAAEEGRQIFTGERHLAGEKGAACVSCHAIDAGASGPVGLSWLGGGLLGPDLTEAYSRLGGERGLAAWLSAPPSPTMKPIFGDDPFSDAEVTMLVAFLKTTAERKSSAALILRSRVPGPRNAGQARDERISPATPALFNSTMIFLVIGLIATVATLAHFDWVWRKRFRAVREPMVRGER